MYVGSNSWFVDRVLTILLADDGESNDPKLARRIETLCELKRELGRR